MSRTNLCSWCMRALQQASRAEQIRHSSAAQQGIRSVSTTVSRWQQPEAPKAPPTPPSTTGTVTSNITATPHPASMRMPQLPKSPLPDLSTAQMQKQISASLQGEDLSTKLARSLRKTAKSATQTYITYGLTEAMFKSCAEQAPYTIPEDQRMGVYTGKGPAKTAGQEDLGIPEDADSWWFKELGLEPTFSTWSQVTYLHMYILTVKLRTLESHSSLLDYQRYLSEHFSHAAEDKMIILHGMNARGIRNRHLKDLFLQWRGVLYAYDQGLVQGDAVLAGAVWRNLWKADENVDWEKVALVVAYIRRAIQATDKVSVEAIAGALETAPSKFWIEAQQGLERSVERKSKGISASLGD